jgi:hypothetical protein
VTYDDGDTEELDLITEKYELVTRSSKKSTPTKKKPETQPRVQKAAKKKADTSAAVDEGLEDSDVDAASDSEGSEYKAMEDDASDDEMDVDDSEDDKDASDAEAEAASDSDILVPRKRPATSIHKTPAPKKKARKSATGTSAQQSPGGENIDTGNGAMRTPTAVGRPSGPAVGSTGKGSTATPRTGQLFGRLSIGTGTAADLTPGGMRCSLLLDPN